MQITLINPQGTLGSYNSGYLNKVTVIKAIRELTGLGLKEAKDACESTEPQTLTLKNEFMEPCSQSELSGPGYSDVDRLCKTIRAEGGIIGGTIHKLLQELRDIGASALKQGEDELANEILQLVLVEKLRRKNFSE